MPYNDPIIVLGNQKAGTTAIASLLADFSNLSLTLDIPEIWDEEREIYSGNLSLESFIESNLQRFSSQLIKEPCLTFLYERLVTVFSESKYIFVLRHPADNIRSILDRLNLPGNLDNAEIKQEIHRAWKDLFYGSLLSTNKKHYITRLAMRWVISAEIYFNHKNNFIIVRYEDFLNDKYNTISELAKKLNLEEKQNISHLINIQYQPKGKNSGVSWNDFYGKQNLRLIKEVCEPYMKIFDYHI